MQARLSDRWHVLFPSLFFEEMPPGPDEIRRAGDHGLQNLRRRFPDEASQFQED
jgi:hypothetical protein